MKTLFYDTETTSKDPAEARIVEIGIHGDGGSRVWRLNPGVLIPPDATAVHGISDADVADCPRFAEVAWEIKDALQCDLLCGFNSVRYDTVLLSLAFERAGVAWVPPKQLDVMVLDKLARPRNLSSAVEHWCNRKHAGAHGAGADALATADVLEAIMAWHPGWKETPLEELASISRYGKNFADPAAKLEWDASNRLVYTFGKWQGYPVTVDRKYAEWVLSQGFPEATKTLIRKALS